MKMPNGWAVLSKIEWHDDDGERDGDRREEDGGPMMVVCMGFAVIGCLIGLIVGLACGR